MASSCAWTSAGLRRREGNARHLVEWTTDIRLLDSTEFEWLVGELYRREGWAVDHVGRSDGPDGNIDLVLTRGRERRIVQCKRVVSSQPILRLLEQLTLEISAASKSRTLRVGPRDLELPNYPERVLREAIINALAHRHYTLPGDTVIRQTSVSLEIENPGGFPEGIDPDSVIQHAPVHRNRLLCELLDRVRVMERSGLGVDRIYEDQLRFGKLPPTYEADRTSVRLRLDAREYDEPFARLVFAEEQAGRRWRVEDLLVLSHLRRMGPTDRAGLARVMQRSERDAQELLGALLGDLIARFGAGPGSKYVLSARVQASFGAEGAYTRERGLAKEVQRRLVLQHANEFGRVDNKAVREMLQISGREATQVLLALEARGQLVMRGARRWAYYEPLEQQTLAL